MIRLYFLVFMVAVFFWLKIMLTMNMNAVQRRKYLAKSMLLVFSGFILLLAITGKLNVIFAGLGVVVTFIWRFLPYAVRYLPQVNRLWTMMKSAPTKNNKSEVVKSSAMSLAEAYKVLGLPVSASREDIILAHQTLILKNHPDRGGSSYLAAQINKAKERLLT